MNAPLTIIHDKPIGPTVEPSNRLNSEREGNRNRVTPKGRKDRFHSDPQAPDRLKKFIPHMPEQTSPAGGAGFQGESTTAPALNLARIPGSGRRSRRGICATDCCTIAVGHVVRLLELENVKQRLFPKAFCGMRSEFSENANKRRVLNMLRKIILGGQTR